jgi:hypothetical protein
VSDFSDWAGITRQYLVDSKQCDSLDCRLRDEKTVEGIFVDQGERTYGDGVVSSDRQFAVTVVQEVRRRTRASISKSSFPKACLIAISHRLAALKITSSSVLLIKNRTAEEIRRGVHADQMSK